MCGFVDEVGVVGGLVVAEVDFAEEVGFDEEAEGAVDGGARGVRVGAADAVEEFFGGEVFVFCEDGSDDAITLRRPSQAFAADEFLQTFANRLVHAGGCLIGGGPESRKMSRSSGWAEAAAAGGFDDDAFAGVRLIGDGTGERGGGAIGEDSGLGAGFSGAAAGEALG